MQKTVAQTQDFPVGSVDTVAAPADTSAPAIPSTMAEPAAALSTGTATIEGGQASGTTESPASATGTEAASGTEAATDTEEEEVPETTKTVDSINDFIKVIVNTRKNDTGRFTLTTVKGDPMRPEDDNKMLIYGEKLPWTSYTTIRIDGKDYVFGGTTKRRAGRNAAYGKVVEDPHETERGMVVTKYEVGGLLVTQVLSITNGPLSSIYDTLKISYTIENNGQTSKIAGIRMLVDTLLGNNDGAPFKVGTRSIQREYKLVGQDVPEYWIAFDSLEKPGVVSRGTLRGEGLTPPDNMIFANWGKLADNPWTVNYKKGLSFLRAGEDELDSAIALYWDEAPLGPGEVRTVSTLYGIEYLNVTGDVLSIGTLRDLGRWPTAPNQIKPHTFYAYVKNTLDFDMQDVEISVKLPDGLRFTGTDDGVRHFDKFEAGHEETVGWEVEPIPFSGADDVREIQIIGRSRQVSAVKGKTKVTLLAPPEIKFTVDAPEALELVGEKDYGPKNPFSIKINCSNTGQSSIDNLKFKLTLPEGLEFPEGQTADKAPITIKPGTDVVNYPIWEVKATGEAYGDLAYTIDAVSESAKPKSVTGTIHVPPMPIKVEVQPALQGSIVMAYINVNNLRNLGRAEFNVTFDPKALAVQGYVTQGSVFFMDQKPLPWKDPIIDNKAGIVKGIVGTSGKEGINGSGTLAVIPFKAKLPGKVIIQVRDLKLTDVNGAPLDYILDNGEVEIVQ